MSLFVWRSNYIEVTGNSTLPALKLNPSLRSQKLMSNKHSKSKNKNNNDFNL